MSIYRLAVPLKPKPKPRGQLNKYGAMTHSLNGYREWQTEYLKHIALTEFKIPLGFYGMIFQFNIRQGVGGLADVSNLQGGVEDILVKAKLIKDDNYRILRHYAAFALEIDKKKTEDCSSIILYVTETKKEFLYTYDKFSD